MDIQFPGDENTVRETLVYSLVNHLTRLVAPKGFTAFNRRKILGLKSFKRFLFKQVSFRVRVTYAATDNFASVKLPYNGPRGQNGYIRKSTHCFIDDVKH